MTLPGGTRFISSSYTLGGAKYIRLPPYFLIVASSVTIWILGMPLSRRSIALKSFFSSFAMPFTSLPLSYQKGKGDAMRRFAKIYSSLRNRSWMVPRVTKCRHSSGTSAANARTTGSTAQSGAAEKV